MNTNNRKKWVQPQLVSLEQLPETLGACNAGNSAYGDGSGPPGQLQCKSGGTAGHKCKTGSTVI